MKIRFLLSFIVLLFPLISFAQLTSNLSVFSENEDKFYLYLNGKLQNDKPLPEVRLEGLTEPYYDAKVVFEDKSLPDLYKKVQVITPQGDPAYSLYKIKQDNEGKLIIYFLSDVPLKQGLTANDNKAFNTYGKDVTKDYVDVYGKAGTGNGGGSSTTIISSTTVTTTTINDDNGGSVVTSTQNGQPTVTQSQTSSATNGQDDASAASVAAGHASISASDIEQGAIEHPKVRHRRRANKEIAAEAAKTDSVSHLSNINTTEPEQKQAFSGDPNDTGLRAIMGAPPVAANPGMPASAPATIITTTPAATENPADTLGRAAAIAAAAQVEGPANCQPLDSVNFSIATQKITDAGDEDAKLAAAKTVVDTNCVTAEQIVIMFHMLGRDRMRLELGKYAYPRTANPRKYFMVTQALETESNKKDMDDYIIYVNNNR